MHFHVGQVAACQRGTGIAVGEGFEECEAVESMWRLVVKITAVNLKQNFYLTAEGTRINWGVLKAH